jgi:hypothetical protein
MFIAEVRSYYDRHGCQKTAPGDFLILCHPIIDGNTMEGLKFPMRAFVARTRLSQLGQFMMGRVSVAGHKLSLSGSYGSDGLPMSLDKELWDAATDVPAELVEAWNKGGGWNGAGTEAGKMRAWAVANLEELKGITERVMKARRCKRKDEGGSIGKV